jgi:CelD/BcsL family acetyltransferase involved in cellulose biosynthesis
MRLDRAGEACGRTRNATVFFGLAIRPGVSDRLARHRGLRPCDGARGNRGGALVDDSFCPAQARCTLRRDTVDLTLSPDLRGATHAEAESCTVEVLELTAAMEYAASWDRLLLDAAYANPFHGYVVLAAHARAGLSDPDMRVLTVRRGEALAAVLPFRPRAGRVGFRRCHIAWTHPSVAINGTPLLHRDGLAETANALLNGMTCVGGSGLWRFPLLAMASAAGQTLLTEARRRQWSLEIVSSFGRAVLDRRLDYETYASHHLSGRRRKSLRRQARRLAGAGRVDLQSCTARADLAEAVEAFLRLEATGWKGHRGTALASSAANADLARTLFAASAGPVTSRADLLRLDGRPIAISLALVCRGRAFLLKTAYDETLRAYGPGVMLEQEIVRAFHEARFADRLDSASLGGGVLESFFPDREPIGDVVIATDEKITPRALSALVAQERLRLAARERVKRGYRALVDLRHPRR